MRNNYQIERSEDSVSKISRSKSKNQVSIVAKLKVKVLPFLILSKANGTIGSISNTFLSTTIKTSHIHNVRFLIYMPDLKNKFRIPNRKYLSDLM